MGCKDEWNRDFNTIVSSKIMPDVEKEAVRIDGMTVKVSDLDVRIQKVEALTSALAGVVYAMKKLIDDLVNERTAK